MSKDDKYQIIKANPMQTLSKVKSEYYDKMKWCFTEKAAFALKDMIKILGIDPDLALYMLEDKWPEKDIYDPNAIEDKE